VPKRDQIEHSRDGIGLLESPERPGRSCSDPSSCSIHPSAWKGNSANFAFWGFSEVQLPLYGVLRSSCASLVL
jgi:hypothetical protein